VFDGPEPTMLASGIPSDSSYVKPRGLLAGFGECHTKSCQCKGKLMFIEGVGKYLWIFYYMCSDDYTDSLQSTL
jgi:hypothetical protein